MTPKLVLLGNSVVSISSQVSRISPCIGNYHVRRFLTDHINRADNEEPGNFRKNRRIHYAQALSSVHFEIAAEHSSVFFRTDGTTARSMMAPGMVAHEVSQFLI